MTISINRLFILLFLALFSCFNFKAYSQYFKSAAWIRISDNWGVSIVQILTKRWTAEMLLQPDPVEDFVKSNLLIRHHLPLITRRFNLYLGAGLNFRLGKSEVDFAKTIGASGIGGLELKLGRLLISYDVVPEIPLHASSDYLSLQTGLSLRYILIKANKKKWNWKKFKFE